MSQIQNDRRAGLGALGVDIDVLLNESETNKKKLKKSRHPLPRSKCKIQKDRGIKTNHTIPYRVSNTDKDVKAKSKIIFWSSFMFYANKSKTLTRGRYIKITKQLSYSIGKNASQAKIPNKKPNIQNIKEYENVIQKLQQILLYFSNVNLKFIHINFCTKTWQ